MTISDVGISLIRQFEGCVLHAYKDAAGIETIGIGHRMLPGESYPNGITEAEAETLLRKDLTETEHCLNASITVPVNQNQYDAITSFSFNLGVGSFREHLLPPSGGSISYTWQPLPFNGSESTPVSRALATRTVSDGVNTSTWTYH